MAAENLHDDVEAQAEADVIGGGVGPRPRRNGSNTLPSSSGGIAAVVLDVELDLAVARVHVTTTGRSGGP